MSENPELRCSMSLEAELQMVSLLPSMRSAVQPSTSSCVEIFHSIVPAMRAMFPTVEVLVRLFW